MSNVEYFYLCLHLNVVDQLRNAAEDKATKILREKLKFTTSAKSAGGKVRGNVRESCQQRVAKSVIVFMMFSNAGAGNGVLRESVKL